MPTLNIRSFIWTRKLQADGTLALSELVPMKHSENGPAAKYPNGGGFASKQDMIQTLLKRMRDLYPYASLELIDNGFKIDYMRKYPNVDVQEVTWED